MNYEKTKQLTKKRWAVLVASCMINLCIGSLYVWSVFAAPMADYLSSVTSSAITASDLAIVFTIANSVGPVTLISGGMINDKFGPKWVVFLGGLMFGIGMIGSGFAKSIPSLMVSYGLGCGLGMGLVYGCTINNSVKLFPDRRGLVGGIATASYGISSVVIPPIANVCIHRMGIIPTFKLLGIVFILVICIGAFFIEKCPEGFVPAGYEEKMAQKKNGGKDKKEHTRIQEEKNWRQMLQDPVFYIMITMLTCGAVFGLMTISQASPIAQQMIGMSVMSATTAVSVLALFNTLGRVAAGYLSDIIGRINVLTIMLVSSIPGLLLICTSGIGDVVKFYIGVSIIGLCFGSFMGVFPGFTADQFGQKNNSVNYGIMFIGFALAGYLGPTIMNQVYSASGNYSLAFVIAIGLAVLGILLSLLYRRKTR